jgi:hypothetical protein
MKSAWLFFSSVVACLLFALGPPAIPEGLDGTGTAGMSSASAGIVLTANESGRPDKSDREQQARTLMKDRRYNDVIRLLAGAPYTDSDNFDLNILLVRAQVEKCVQLKDQGDMAYKTLSQQTYDTAQMLHQKRAHHELYYVTAKCLLISDRPFRAAKTIKKALRFAPDEIDYLLVLADAYMARAASLRKSDKDSYFAQSLVTDADALYGRAYELAKDDEYYRSYIDRRMAQ